MPEAVVDQPQTGSETGDTGNQHTQSPGWLAGLPADLRDNEAFKSYRTVGDFAKAHLETASKAKEYEGKLQNSIVKLGENATQEERDKFYNSLGRPEKPEGYELEGGDKEKEKLLSPWKERFHKLGLTSSQAKGLKAEWDAHLNSLVDAYKADIEKKNAKAESDLKTVWGDKHDTNVELAKRLWKGEMTEEERKEADAHFESLPAYVRNPFLKIIFKFASKTGEDVSQRGAGYRGPAVQENPYPKSVMPPRRM